jgi:chemotaxis signal transduction protein/chemotaxis regulatin CheY-phosphate phosphatase CheZ
VQIARGDKHAMPPDMQQFLSFHVGETECAVDCSLVLEVIRFTELTRFAGLAGTFVGAIYRHGGFLPIVDLRHPCICPTPPPNNHSRIIILNVSGSEVGVLVDHLGEIVQLSTSAIHPLPTWISASKTPYFKGISPVEGRWLLILAPAQLLPDSARSAEASAWSSALSPVEGETPNSTETAAHQKRIWRHKVPRQPQDSADQEVQLQSNLDAHSIKELEEMAKAMSEGDFHRQVSSKIQGELENLAAYIAKTMSNLRLLDPSVRISAEHDIPAASQQLSDVVKSTEEATNTIISLTEMLLDHQTVLGEAIEKLKGQKYRNRDHQELLHQIERLHWEDEKTLMEIITNLSFQDLTGQRINKIVTMVATVQAKLCDLIQAFGIKVQAAVGEAAQATALDPVGKDTGKLAQHSVDSLLNQLFN